MPFIFPQKFDSEVFPHQKQFEDCISEFTDMKISSPIYRRRSSYNEGYLETKHIAQSRRLSFQVKQKIYPVLSHREYDRTKSSRTTHLNSSTIKRIKAELNDLKSEMVVHQESRMNTVFYDV